MKHVGKNFITFLSIICMLSVTITGCGSKSTASPEDNKEPNTSTEADKESPKDTERKWETLDDDTAKAIDADFQGTVWNLEEDKFYIAEEITEVFDDGSMTSVGSSADSEIEDADLIPVIYDETTSFTLRTITDGGNNFKDQDSGPEDLELYMSVELKGSFQDDVFYATEIRLIKVL